MRVEIDGASDETFLKVCRDALRPRGELARRRRPDPRVGFLGDYCEVRLKDRYALGECMVSRETCGNQSERGQDLSAEVSGGPLSSQQGRSHVELMRDQEILKARKVHAHGGEKRKKDGYL